MPLPLTHCWPLDPEGYWVAALTVSSPKVPVGSLPPFRPPSFPFIHTVWLADQPLICKQQQAQRPSQPLLFSLVLSLLRSLLYLCLRSYKCLCKTSVKTTAAFCTCWSRRPCSHTLTITNSSVSWDSAASQLWFSLLFLCLIQRRKAAICSMMEEKNCRSSVSGQHERHSLFQWFLIILNNVIYVSSIYFILQNQLQYSHLECKCCSAKNFFVQFFPSTCQQLACCRLLAL